MFYCSVGTGIVFPVKCLDLGSAYTGSSHFVARDFVAAR